MIAGPGHSGFLVWVRRGISEADATAGEESARLLPVVDVARLDPIRRPIDREGVQDAGGHALHEPFDGLVAEPEIESAIRNVQLGSHVAFKQRDYPFRALVAQPIIRHGRIVPLPLIGMSGSHVAARSTLSGRPWQRVDRTRGGQASWTDGHQHPPRSC
jgi:hypothetical protein